MQNSTNEHSAWMLIAAGTDNYRNTEAPYPEDPKTGYRWNSRVRNHAQISVGDLVAIRSKNALIGASIVETIEKTPGEVDVRQCPNCKKSSFKKRTTKTPRYACAQCKLEFDEPISIPTQVINYRSDHQNFWIDLPGLFSSTQLREFYLHPKTQNSISRMHWDAFTQSAINRSGSFIVNELCDLAANISEVATNSSLIAGGHRLSIVRTRIGQADFRRSLLDKYGATCFVSGPQPPEALDAAHLCAYSVSGKHDPFGGILLRKDLHALFDRKMLSFNPSTREIVIGGHLLKYPQYAVFNRAKPQVALSPKQLHWFQIHFNSFIAQ